MHALTLYVYMYISWINEDKFQIMFFNVVIRSSQVQSMPLEKTKLLRFIFVASPS